MEKYSSEDDTFKQLKVKQIILNIDISKLGSNIQCYRKSINTSNQKVGEIPKNWLPIGFDMKDLKEQIIYGESPNTSSML